MKYYPAGDRAIVVEFGNEINEKVNGKVHAFARLVEEKKINGIIEILPTFCTLMISYAPEKISYFRLMRKLKSIKLKEGPELAEVKRILHVPCCYEAPFGEDLPDMEQLLGLSRKEIVEIHSQSIYKIYMLGFLPGFVYLGGLDPRIETPRLQTPRVRIEPGSVGIGGNQTGVYPVASPGGWRLIGNTPLLFYNPQSKNPCLCEAGESIQFEPICYEEYCAIAEKVKVGQYRPQYSNG